MKIVILAGGFGTRISEESHLKPKPMIEIGEKPILWHIMKHYSHYGFNEFVICCGYKQQVIKEFFANYYLYGSDITFDFTSNNEMVIHNNISEPWKVTLVDTGLNTMTGGRLKRIQPYITEDEFMVTYGDGVSDINIAKLLEYHHQHKKVGTMTVYNQGQRFGVVQMDNAGTIERFTEKALSDGAMINIGFMVFNKKIFDYIDGDTTVFEKEPLENLAKNGELKAYIHEGFWHCMDTKRDHDKLNTLWDSGNAPWKTW